MPMTTDGFGRWRDAVPVLGIPIARVDYRTAVEYVIDAASRRASTTVSALAVHGVMTGVLDTEHGARLRAFDMLTPDGQPVRWAVNVLRDRGQQSALEDRVYGPLLTLKICEAAAQRGVSIYLYGSRPETVAGMATRLRALFPSLEIAGIRPSRFRDATPEEDADDIDDIHASGAGIVFVGLGCPRQEKWAYEHRNKLNAVMVCVGAAFDFHAGTLAQAPAWMQNIGTEWLFRLLQEPRRLWKRYLLLNPAYLFLVGVEVTRKRLLRMHG